VQDQLHQLHLQWSRPYAERVADPDDFISVWEKSIHPGLTKILPAIYGPSSDWAAENDIETSGPTIRHRVDIIGPQALTPDQESTVRDEIASRAGKFSQSITVKFSIGQTTPYRPDINGEGIRGREPDGISDSETAQPSSAGFPSDSTVLSTPSRDADPGSPPPATNGYDTKEKALTSPGRDSNSSRDDDDDDDDAPPPPTGIRWAPLRIPLERRKQTLAVALHCSFLLMSVPVFFLCCANPLLWILIIPYTLYVMVSNAGVSGEQRWRSKYVRSLWIWRSFAAFFPAELVKTADLPSNRKYIFGYHPHGIIAHGAWAAFATEALGFSQKFPGINNSLLTLDNNFKVPFYREYLLLHGVASVSKESIQNNLKKGGLDGKGAGRAVTIVVGGAREALCAHPGTMKLILKGRYGFIKVAMHSGADLVPVLCFGENELYDQTSAENHPWIYKVQMTILKFLRFTLPVMRGRGSLNYDYGLLPHRRRLRIVGGRPIPTPHVIAQGDAEMDDIKRVHDLYCAELQRLWDENKDVYAKNRTEELKFLT